MSPAPDADLRRRDLLPYLFQSLAREASLAALGLSPGEHALEVGLGRGETLLRIAALVGPTGRAVGIDADERARALAQARLREAGYGHAEVREGLPHRIPLQTAELDAAYAAYLLDDLPEPDVAPALAEAARVLRPGGRLAICGLAPGERPLSRTLSAALRRLRPPRDFVGAARSTGLALVQRLYIEQRGLPSAVLLLRKPG